MHGLFAGLMGIFMSFGAFFHGGAGATHAQANVQANLSGTPQASPSGALGRGRFRMNIPAGERPFFGTVTNVNGSTLTIQMAGMMRGRDGDSDTDTTNTTSTPRSFTVTVDGSTKYTGGSQSDITTNTKVSGVGKVNSDGSLTAVSVTINPTFPSGMPFRRGMGRGDDDR